MQLFLDSQQKWTCSLSRPIANLLMIQSLFRAVAVGGGGVVEGQSGQKRSK